jgi:hypothetical protein
MTSLLSTAGNLGNDPFPRLPIVPNITHRRTGCRSKHSS